jgi:hypothetical protein
MTTQRPTDHERRRHRQLFAMTAAMLLAVIIVGRLSDAFVPRLIAGTIMLLTTTGLLVAVLMSYWRVSNLPTTLLHFTTSATADRIVTATRPVGTYDAVFLARPSPVPWLLPSVHPCKPRVYFFNRWPVRVCQRSNGLRRCNVCLEVVRLDPTVRRVWRRIPGWTTAIDGDVRAVVRRHELTRH